LVFAWTSGGGDILNVEAILMEGPDRLQLTGRLGNVMQESARAALTYVRANTSKFGIPRNFQKGKEIHIHVPEGATPKDGPSAGLTMTVALVSAAGKKPVRTDVAMTGEINLNGEVLPIGGLTEKLLAAKRYGIKKVLVPRDNLKDLSEIPGKLKEGISIVPVERIEDAMPHVFGAAGKKKRDRRTKMSYLVTARKWRPMRFDQVTAQEHVTVTMKNAITRNRIAHAYLFSGPSGVGKTTTARILPRQSTARTQKTANRATSVTSAGRSQKEEAWTSSRLTVLPIAVSTKSATCASR